MTMTGRFLMMRRVSLLVMRARTRRVAGSTEGGRTGRCAQREGCPKGCKTIKELEMALLRA